MKSNPLVKINELIEQDYLIVVDTNVLLGLYRLSPDYADFALKCLEKIKSFIRIPYVVALEFSRHNRKLYKDRQLSIKNSISDNLTMIENHKKKVLNAIAVLEKRNFPEIDELLNSVGACYDKATSLLDDYFDEHSVLTLINDTWNSDLPEDFLDELQNNQQIMAPLELSEIYGICDDGEKRYKKENPPGYKDAKKKDGIRKYSDLIWWKEVIQYARKSRKNIVLVTDDVKEDWWTIDEKGQYLFRGELITEFEKETKIRANQNQGTQLESLKLIPFISSDFYTAVANSYNIEKADAIGLAMNLTDKSYISHIQEKVFDDILDDLIFSGTQYVNDTVTYVGTEGIESWDLEDCEFLGYEIESRDGNTIYYRLNYSVCLSGYSHDYWGRDEDTKAVILSEPFYHEVKGEISVLVCREADLLIDYEEDDDYASAEIEEGDLSEVVYKDYQYEPEPDQEELKTLNYENFIKSRHSIRHFGSEAVDVELLREAIQIAQYTPSACNRQGWVIRIVESKDAIDTILENQNGNRGFGHEIDKLVMITCDVRAFQKNRELFQPYIDGGMYAQSVLNALYYKGIGAIPLSASLAGSQEKK